MSRRSRARRLRIDHGSHAGSRPRAVGRPSRRWPRAPAQPRRDRRALGLDAGRPPPGAWIVRTIRRHAIMTTMSFSPSAELTSPANPRVKAVRALRDRRERDRAGMTLIDGVRELRRALDAGIAIEEAYIC